MEENSSGLFMYIIMKSHCQLCYRKSSITTRKY